MGQLLTKPLANLDADQPQPPRPSTLGRNMVSTLSGSSLGWAAR
jgi:hypothetical protein